jgi:hypothetical protein
MRMKSRNRPEKAATNGATSKTFGMNAAAAAAAPKKHGVRARRGRNEPIAPPRAIIAATHANEGIVVNTHGSAASDASVKIGMRAAERSATARPKEAPAAMERMRWLT